MTTMTQMTTPTLSSWLSRPLLKSRINPKPHVEVNSCDQNSDLNWCSNLHLVFLCSNTYFYNTQEYLYSLVENTYPLRRYMLFHAFSLSCYLLAQFVCCFLLAANRCTMVHIMRTSAIKSSDSKRRRLSMNIAISKTRQ